MKGNKSYTTCHSVYICILLISGGLSLLNRDVKGIDLVYTGTDFSLKSISLFKPQQFTVTTNLKLTGLLYSLIQLVKFSYKKVI